MSHVAEPLALNDREAARLLNVSRSTFRLLVKSGQIRAVRARRRLLIPVASVYEFLASSSNPTGAIPNAPENVSHESFPSKEPSESSAG